MSNKNSGILSNYDLDNLLKYLNIDKYKIISKDELKKNKNINNYIINMSDSNQPGTHWISLIINHNKKKCYYFDSYGIIYPEIVSKIFNNYTIIYNKTQIQDINNKCCGWFCIYFIYFMIHNNNNLSKFIKIFNKKELTKNDDILVDYFEKLIN